MLCIFENRGTFYPLFVAKKSKFTHKYQTCTYDGNLGVDIKLLRGDGA